MILHAAAMGQGPPVALLHGLFGQSRNFATLQKQLAATHRVLALDLRNHGQSPHAPGMTYPTQAEDVLETLRHHAALPGTLIGHSMGGKVAMAAALAAPAAVTRLLVADIAPIRYPPHFDDIIAAMRAMTLHPGLTRAEAAAQLAPVTATESLRGFLLQNLNFTGTPAWRIGLEEIAAAQPDISDWPATDDAPSRVPTLVVAGERSDYIRPEHRELFRTLFPNARFATLRNAGHWLHADNQEGFLALVQAFLT